MPDCWKENPNCDLVIPYLDKNFEVKNACCLPRFEECQKVFEEEKSRKEVSKLDEATLERTKEELLQAYDPGQLLIDLGHEVTHLNLQRQALNNAEKKLSETKEELEKVKVECLFANGEKIQEGKNSETRKLLTEKVLNENNSYQQAFKKVKAQEQEVTQLRLSVEEAQLRYTYLRNKVRLTSAVLNFMA